MFLLIKTEENCINRASWNWIHVSLDHL